jgi:hypothetical protein
MEREGGTVSEQKQTGQELYEAINGRRGVWNLLNQETRDYFERWAAGDLDPDKRGPRERRRDELEVNPERGQ